MFGILIALIFAAVLALAIYGGIQAHKRRQALVQWCATRGFSFDTARDFSFDERFAEFSALRQGSNRYACNIIHGSLPAGRALTGFDYHYETHSTDNKGRRRTHHHWFSAAIVETGLPLKPLAIRSESFLDKIAEFAGFDDIDFESSEFSRKFHVSSPDRRWAFDVIHQQTMEFLLAMPRFSIQMHGSRVLARQSGRFHVDQYEQALAVVTGLLDRLPAYLLRDLGVAPVVPLQGA
jgi:hypothetical protein